MKPPSIKAVKKYPLTAILIVIIGYLSFFTPPETPLSQVRFIDKWTHLILYGTLTLVLWTEDRRTLPHRTDIRRTLCLYLGAVAMSGCIELLQAYCTTNRSGDWLDLAANAAGGLIGILLARIADRQYEKRKSRRTPNGSHSSRQDL